MRNVEAALQLRGALLAKIEGMNVQVAKESIERYNQLAKAGSDEDFGKSSQRMFALENGPFYAAECGVALTLANLGGLESDSDCHVSVDDTFSSRSGVMRNLGFSATPAK